MKRNLIATAIAIVIACILSVCASAQNKPTLPEDVAIKHTGGIGHGPRRTEQVVCAVAVDENDQIVECVEECEENAEYIETLASDPRLFVTEVIVEVETEE